MSLTDTEASHEFATGIKLKVYVFYGAGFLSIITHICMCANVM